MVRPETSFREAVRLLDEHGVDALPVVHGTGRVVGVLSESDLLLKEEAQDSRRGLPWQRRSDRLRAAATTVEGVMCRRPVTVSPDATLSAAARLMHRHRVGGLPVVDRDARLLGIVTRRTCSPCSCGRTTTCTPRCSTCSGRPRALCRARSPTAASR